MSEVQWPSMVVQRLSDVEVRDLFRDLGTREPWYTPVIEFHIAGIHSWTEAPTAGDTATWNIVDNIPRAELPPGSIACSSIVLRTKSGNPGGAFVTAEYRRQPSSSNDHLILHVAKEADKGTAILLVQRIQQAFNQAGLDALRTLPQDWGSLPAGLAELTSKLALAATGHQEQVAELTKHFREQVEARGEYFEEEEKKRRLDLQNEREKLQAEIAAERTALDEVRKTLELADARSSRRKSRQAIANDLIQIAQLGLTGVALDGDDKSAPTKIREKSTPAKEATNQLEKSESLTFWAAVTSIFLFGVVLAASVFYPVYFDGLEWLTTASRIGSALALAGSIAFLMRILTAREIRLANERRRQERIFIDIARANWVVEMLHEWRDNATQEGNPENLPPEFVAAMTRNLFEFGKDSVAPEHPADGIFNGYKRIGALKMDIKNGTVELQDRKS